MARAGSANFKRKLATIQKKIAAARDNLREQEAELAELLSTAEEVHGGLADGLESLEYAIERISEQQ